MKFPSVIDGIEDWEADALRAIQDSRSLLDNSSPNLDILKSHHMALRKALACVERVANQLSGAAGLLEDKLLPMMRCEGIKSLPSEIMGKIFELVVEEPGGSPAVSAYGAISLSHVSKTWRRAALDTPRLWKRIELWNGLDRVQVFLERSKAVLLDIYLTPGDDHDHFNISFRDDAEFVSPTQKKGLPAAIASAVVHAHRWRSFSWVTYYVDEEYDIVRDNCQNAHMPCLEEVKVGDIADILFLDPLPSSVRSLHLTDHIPSNPDNSLLEFFVPLTSLTCYIEQGQFGALSHFPNLTTLQLDWRESDDGSKNATRQVELRFLEHLTLNLFDKRNVELFCFNVKMPILNTLALRLVGNSNFSPSIDLGWPTFTQVGSLSISLEQDQFSMTMGSDPSYSNIFALNALLDNLPALHSLKLSYFGDRWEDTVSALRFHHGILKNLEIEDCKIQPGDLALLLRYRGVGSHLPIDHIAVRRCVNIPLEIKPHLEQHCKKLGWESYWTKDVDDHWDDCANVCRPGFSLFNDKGREEWEGEGEGVLWDSEYSGSDGGAPIDVYEL